MAKKLLSNCAVIILLLHISCVTVFRGANGKLLEGNHPKELIHLGEADGKEFYWDNSIPARSWTQASAFCQSEGLQLASIETQNQTNFLATAIYKNNGFLSYSWTAGTERRSIENFQWNNTQRSLDPDAIPNFEYYNSSNHYCISFYVGAQAAFKYYAEGCSKINTGVLCQK